MEQDRFSVRRTRTEVLSKLLEHYIDPNQDTRVYWAKEVTFDYTTDHKRRVDYMRFKPLNNSVSGIEKGDFYCYEIKSCAEDFRSPNGHNFLGDYNYYVMPREVFAEIQTEIPYDIGVLVPDGNTLKSAKKALRRDREKSMPEMLLMMWRSAARDARKRSD